MPTLHETQARMAAHLIYGGPTDDLMPLLADGAAALDIHRNTIESVLGNALRLTFPALNGLSDRTSSMPWPGLRPRAPTRQRLP